MPQTVKAFPGEFPAATNLHRMLVNSGALNQTTKLLRQTALSRYRCFGQFLAQKTVWIVAGN